MKEFINFMLDIETLDTKESSVILQIACVAFKNDGTIIDEYDSGAISIQDQIDKGRTISESTLRFWMSQPKELQTVMFCYTDKNLGYAISELDDFIKKYITSDSIVWAKSPQFDCSKIEHAYRTIFEDYIFESWHFWQVRDVRTIKMVLTKKENEIVKFEGVEHNALDDGKYQIKQVCRALDKIILSDCLFPQTDEQVEAFERFYSHIPEMDEDTKERLFKSIMEGIGND